MIIEVARNAVIETLETRGWTQGNWGATDPKASTPLCLHGAIRVCQPIPGDAYIIEQVWARRGRGTNWNDEEDTTKNDVLFALHNQPPITDDELSEVFGPQWEEIVSLVRRAAVLTRGEAINVASAWNAAWNAARGAARNAAWNAARGAVWNAARDAAWDAARGAARNAVRNAARSAAWDAAAALQSRDLIGETFTQEQYNLLTKPWRDAIGPVHPED